MTTAVQSDATWASPSWQLGVAAAVTATAIGLWTVVTGLRYSGNPPWLDAHGLPAWTPWPALIAVCAIIGSTWATRTEHPRASAGLAVAAAGVLLPLWAGWRSLPDVVGAGLLAAAPLAIGGTAQVILGWTGDRRHRSTARSRVAFALVGVAVLVHLLGYNPFADPGCAAVCADVLPPLAVAMSTRTAVIVTSAASAAAACVLASAVWQCRRVAPRLVVGVVVAALVVHAAASAARWFAWGVPGVWDVLLATAPASVTLAAAAAAVAVGRTMRTRAALDRMVARLSNTGPTADDRRVGVLAVHYAAPGAGRWVDDAGHDVSGVAHDARTVVVSDDAGPVLRLVLRDTADEGDVLASFTPAGVLALRNAQLSAVAKARLADVRAAQRRIVVASDAERVRIERDLHDGAQQRLVSVAFHLKVAAGGAEPYAAVVLDRAHGHVRDALARLRRLAHGTVPSALADEGLDAALQELVATSEVPAALHVDLEGPVALEPAMAAFHAAAATLRPMRTEPGVRVRLSVVSSDRAIRVRATVEGRRESVVTLECADITDRVNAAGGTLSVTTSEDGTVTVTAVIPCRS